MAGRGLAGDVKIGLVGKPNVGKSTFFSAATAADAAIGDYPFTTIDANHGVAFVRVEDPGPGLGVTSTPRAGRVAGGTRYVPVELVDVAGLVPGAHEGRGLGNRFLSELSRADVLVHVVDAAGATDAEGNPVSHGDHDPLDDVRFLTEEIDAWIFGLLEDGWERVARRVQQEHRKLAAALDERLAGIGVDEAAAVAALRAAGLADKRPDELAAQDLAQLAAAVRAATKPLVLAWNKADVAGADRVAALQEGVDLPGHGVSTQAELALQRGARSGLLRYDAGAASFEVTGTPSEAQKTGLDYIRTHVLEPFGSTGVTKVLETAVFDLLGMVPVFPVEDEAHYTDKEGRVLPDCHLVPKGTTARQLAYRVHTDLGEHFVRAIDCRTHRAVAADHELAAGDIVKIAAKA